MVLRSGKLVYGPSHRGRLIAVVFTLTLSVQLSCNSTYKEKWQSLSDTCEMEIDVGCKDSTWCKPLSMGCWGWGGFLQRPCPDACPLLGRS